MIVINFKFCHRSYKNKGGIEDDGEVTDEENEYEEVGKPNILNKEVEKEKKTKKKILIDLSRRLMENKLGPLCDHHLNFHMLSNSNFDFFRY